MKRALSQFALTAVAFAFGITLTTATAFAQDPKEDGKACVMSSECTNECIASKCAPAPTALTADQETLVGEFLTEKAGKFYSLSHSKSLLKAFLNGKEKGAEFDRLSTYLGEMTLPLHPCDDSTSDECFTLAASIYFGFGSTVETATESWGKRQNWSRAKFNAAAAKDLEASFLECFPGIEYAAGLDTWRGAAWTTSSPVFVCRAKERHPSRGAGVTQYRPFKATKYATEDHNHDDRYYPKGETYNRDEIDNRIPKAAPAPSGASPAPQKVK